ncbi:MAG: hypothetical protein CVT49_00765 [candidate division Zixibacteria bacterium HGW-Zixibacteria-1]|nr:MAG: hypothetical protein CVT49_00765 [candidate division Zixibacteria bacterium HGW-Zixibacteria-1]
MIANQKLIASFSLSILLVFTSLVFSSEKDYKIVIHPGTSEDIRFEALNVNLASDNWVNDRIRVDIVGGATQSGSLELSKDHPIYLQKEYGSPYIQLRFTNNNMLDFTIAVVESSESGKSQQSSAAEIRAYEAIINTTPEMVVSQDIDIQKASKAIQVPMPINNRRDYDRAVSRYEEYMYYLGRIEVKLGTLSSLAGMEREIQARFEATKRYVADADQGHMVPPIENYLVGLDIRLDPKERFSRRLYNNYAIAQDNLRKQGDFLFKGLLIWVAQTHEMVDANRESEGLSVYRRGLTAHDQGIAEMGGMNQASLLSRKFSRDVLIPIFEKAKTTEAPESAQLAAVDIISFLSGIGR